MVFVNGGHGPNHAQTIIMRLRCVVSLWLLAVLWVCISALEGAYINFETYKPVQLVSTYVEPVLERLANGTCGTKALGDILFPDPSCLYHVPSSIIDHIPLHIKETILGAFVATATLSDVSIGGLGSIDAIRLLHPLSPSKLQFSVEVSQLNVTALLPISVSRMKNDDLNYTEVFGVSAEIHNLTVDITLDIQVNRSLLSSSFGTFKKHPGCLSKYFNRTVFDQIDVRFNLSNVRTITPTTPIGDKGVIRAAVFGFLKSYVKKKTCGLPEKLHRELNGKLRQKVNDEIAHWRKDTKCPSKHPGPLFMPTDFGAFSYINDTTPSSTKKLFRFLFEDVIGFVGRNRAYTCLTDVWFGTPGYISIPKEIYSIESGKNNVSFSDLIIHNLDSIDRFDVRVPENSFNVSLTFDMKLLNATWRTNGNMGPVVYDQAVGAFAMSDISVDANATIVVDLGVLKDFKSIHQIQSCAASAITAAVFRELRVDAGYIDVSTLGVDLNFNVSKTLSYVFVENPLHDLRPFGNEQLAKVRRLDPVLCPGKGSPVVPTEPLPPVPEQKTGLFIVAGFIIAIIAFIIVYWMQSSTQHLVRKSSVRTRVHRKSMVESPDHRGHFTEPSLLSNGTVNPFVRYSIPVLLITNMGLFLYVHIMILNDVIFTVNLPGSSVSFPSIYQFSVFHTVSDLWKPGLYPLSVFVFLLSGAWPYVKLILALLCWVLPERRLALQSRERIAFWVDALGKWSLVDVYIVVFLISAFQLHVDLTETLKLDLEILPNTGFFVFQAAVVISMILSHVVVYYIDRTRFDASSFGDSVEALHRHSYSFTDKGHSKLTLKGKIAITSLLGISLILCVLTLLLNSFHYEFSGLLSPLLYNNARQPYSMLTLEEFVARNWYAEGVHGVLLLRVLYYLFATVVPIILVIVLPIVFFTPLPLMVYRRLVYFCQILNAWVGLDVFSISMIVAVLETPKISQVLVQRPCRLFRRLVAMTTTAKLQTDSCFNVTTVLMEGSSVAFVTALVFILVVTSILRLYRASLDERLDRESKIYSENYALLEDSPCDDDDEPEMDPWLLRAFKFFGIVKNSSQAPLLRSKTPIDRSRHGLH